MYIALNLEIGIATIGDAMNNAEATSYVVDLFPSNCYDGVRRFILNPISDTCYLFWGEVLLAYSNSKNSAVHSCNTEMRSCPYDSRLRSNNRTGDIGLKLGYNSTI